MIFKNMYFQVILRVALIVASSLFLSYSHFLYKNPITSVNLFGFILLQAILLIHYLNKVNREIMRFMTTIKSNDSSFVKPEIINKSYRLLWEKFEEINKTIRDIKAKNEKQNIYFETVTEHIPTGLISIDQNGHIDIMNRAAQKFLNPQKNLNSSYRLDETILNKFKTLDPNLPELFKYRVNDDIAILSLTTAELKEKNTTKKLISIQNISSELDNKELESWHKLIQVINHEIRNSVAPMSSTINTLNEYLTLHSDQIERSTDNHLKKVIKKTSDGLSIMKEQSNALNEFINKYQYFSNIPKLKLSIIDLQTLIASCSSLFKQQFKSAQLEILISANSEPLQINADHVLLERMLINLLSNAMHAHAKNIKIKFFKNEQDRIQINIEDDGNGIPDEFIDKIFIPFFTTREEGSGIGLSFSKQIMQLHNGSISVQSKVNSGTTFILKF